MINRKELKEKIPHGYIKKIAQRAKVSERLVSYYLSGKVNSERVEMATLQLLAELSTTKKELLAKII